MPRVIVSRKQEARIASDTRSAKRSENDATGATNSKNQSPVLGKNGKERFINNAP
jgi:hypothetical protein